MPMKLNLSLIKIKTKYNQRIELIPKLGTQNAEHFSRQSGTAHPRR
jgi:hypothetical protein